MAGDLPLDPNPTSPDLTLRMYLPLMAIWTATVIMAKVSSFLFKKCLAKI